MTLYHISPASNRDSISRLGIDPVFSKGKLDVCWFVDQSKLVWAVAHCSARHSVSVDKLDVWVVETPLKRQRKTAWRGVFNTPCRTIAARHVPAVTFLDKERSK